MSTEGVRMGEDQDRKEYTQIRQELAKEVAADLRAQDSARTGNSQKLIKKTQAVMGRIPVINVDEWHEMVKSDLAHALALGNARDYEGFTGDGEIDRVVRQASIKLQSDPVARGGFIAELLALALKNGEQVFSGEAYEGNDAKVKSLEELLSGEAGAIRDAVKSLVKNLDDRTFSHYIPIANAQSGRTLARQAWKVVEARASWVRARTDIRANNVGVHKFAGKTNSLMNTSGAVTIASLQADLDQIGGSLEQIKNDHYARIGSRRS